MTGWYSFNDQMSEMFGGKVYRLSLSAGLTCPNRDGTCGTGGCIFCSAGGSGDFAASAGDVDLQIEEAKARVACKIGRGTHFAGYMAYFQPFTNTYGDQERLAGIFEGAAARPDIVALSVATRPDCLSDGMVERLAGISARKLVFVELGLQTVHQDTADYINRCYRLEVFEDAFMRLKRAGIRVAAHVIIGLPGEDAARTRETVAYLSGLRCLDAVRSGTRTDSGTGARMSRNDCLDGIKLQLLYVLKGTALSGLLPDGDDMHICGDTDTFPRGYIRLKDGMRLPQYTLDEYAALVCSLIRMLPEGTAVHRVTGDPPKRDLILPLWTADKKRVLNTIYKTFYTATSSLPDT